MASLDGEAGFDDEGGDIQAGFGDDGEDLVGKVEIADEVSVAVLGPGCRDGGRRWRSRAWVGRHFSVDGSAGQRARAYGPLCSVAVAASRPSQRDGSEARHPYLVGVASL